MGDIEYDGKVYCDWRIKITGCEEASFFKWVYLSSSIAASISWLLFFACFFIRKVLMGEPWKGFCRGDNSTMLLFLVVLSFILIHLLLVLLGAPPVINGIFWTFLSPMKSFHLAYVTEMLLTTTPNAIVPRESLLLNDRTRPKILYSLATILTVTNVTLISTSFFFLNAGYTSVGVVLGKIGLTISALNLVAICGILSYCCLTLFFKIKRVFAEIHSFEQAHTETDRSLLILASKKLLMGGIGAISNGVYEGIYFLVLAFYPSFFINLGFSKTIAAALNILNSSSLLFCGLILVIIDVKRWLFKEESSSTHSAKKKPSTLPQSSQVNDEGIEMAIEELRPKSLDLNT